MSKRPASLPAFAINSAVGGLQWLRSPIAPQGFPMLANRRTVYGIDYVIILLILLFGGGFGYYRGGYHSRGGWLWHRRDTGVVLIVVLIVWLLRGHLGAF